MEKSKGHMFFIDINNVCYEYYTDGIDVFRGPVSNVIDCLTGYRIGRYESSLVNWNHFNSILK